MYGFITLALAACAAALPATSRNENILERALSDSYRFYQGDGTVAAGWPLKADWSGWDELWNFNANIMKSTCGWNNWGAENSATEIANIKSAILQLSSETGVDNRFILAVMMQESKGCVRAPTTNNGVRNPGLMQSHNGSGSCAGVNPCPASQITQMIRDGVAGTQFGDGLKQTLDKGMAGTPGGSGSSRAHYAAARIYNSGSIDWSNFNNGLGSTACYATDVANRLHGWCLAATGCHL